MKCAEFRIFLETLSKAITPLGALGPASQLRALCPLMDAQPQKSVAAILAKLSGMCALQQAGEAPVALAPLGDLVDWYEAFGKPAAAKDLSAVLEVLQKMRVANVETFVASAAPLLAARNALVSPEPREDVVEHYCRVLEASLGKEDGFAAIMADVSNEANVRANELVLIAKRFGSGAVRTKPAALKKIWSRQHAVQASQAKAAATAGRIAG